MPDGIGLRAGSLESSCSVVETIEEVLDIEHEAAVDGVPLAEFSKRASFGLLRSQSVVQLHLIVQQYVLGCSKSTIVTSLILVNERQAPVLVATSRSATWLLCNLCERWKPIWSTLASIISKWNDETTTTGSLCFEMAMLIS